MTVPQEYWTATRDFERFMADLKDISLLTTHNQCYHMTRAVLHVFRAHLSVADALAFAEALPPVLRAIFVEGWVANGEVAPFPDRDQLMVEVMSIRRDHNVSTPTAIGDVAAALLRHVDRQRFDAVLSQLSPAAAEFWQA